jgi:anaerobic ribonucleoside-triphosphate reductase activating protein
MKAATRVEPEALIERCAVEGIEGITVSGGEPLLQTAALTELLKAAQVKGLTAIVYTGYTLEEISGDARLSGVLDHIDVLVDGRFDINRMEPTLLARGSTNQKIHFLTNVYKEEDMYMAGKAEIIIDNQGRVTRTGFSKIERLAS